MLQHARLPNPRSFMDAIAQGVEALAEAGIVHSDLSPFNILVSGDRPVFIDLAAAIRVDRLGWPPGIRLAEGIRFLESGIGSLERYFRATVLRWSETSSSRDLGTVWSVWPAVSEGGHAPVDAEDSLTSPRAPSRSSIRCGGCLGGCSSGRVAGFCPQKEWEQVRHRYASRYALVKDARRISSMDSTTVASEGLQGSRSRSGTRPGISGRFDGYVAGSFVREGAVSDPVSLVEIQAAHERIRSTVLRSPLVPSPGREGLGNLLLKLDNLQPTGSFKVKGAGNSLAVAFERGHPRACTRRARETWRKPWHGMRGA